MVGILKGVQSDSLENDLGYIIWSESELTSVILEYKNIFEALGEILNNIVEGSCNN